MSALAMVVLDLYISTFAARLDAYVRDSQRHVHETITPALAEDALTEGWSISGYMGDQSGPDEAFVTHVGAVDIDSDEPGAPKAIRDVLWSHGIPTLLAQSRRGAHLWTLHEGDGSHGSEAFGRVPAGTVRRALTAAVGLSGLSREVQSHCEVFPKASTSAWGVGALRLPLMRHPKSGERYPVIDMDGGVIEKVTELVNAAATMTAPWPKVWALAGGDAGPVEYPRHIGQYRSVRTHDLTAPTISGLLSGMGLEVRPGHTSRCPFHEDRHASMSVAKDDERVFCHAPTCAIHNGGRGLGSLGLRKYLSQAVAR